MWACESREDRVGGWEMWYWSNIPRWTTLCLSSHQWRGEPSVLRLTACTYNTYFMVTELTLLPINRWIIPEPGYYRIPWGKWAVENYELAIVILETRIFWSVDKTQPRAMQYSSILVSKTSFMRTFPLNYLQFQFSSFRAW